MRNVGKELRIRRRMIRRLIRAQRDAVALKFQPAVIGLDLILFVTERAAEDHTLDPAI